LLLFWRACGHKRCLRARACALESNDCFRRFWPLVPELLKISIRAGMEASVAGLSKPEIAAAPPPRVAAPARSGPRIRML